MTGNKIYKWLGFLALLLMMSAPIQAQQAKDELIAGMNNDWILIGALGATFVTLLFIFIVLSGTMFYLTKDLSPKPGLSPEAEKEPFWTWFWLKLNAAVPKTKEKDILLNHEYDGIRELDNDLPPWWKYGFYISIVISVVYLFVYHGGHYDHDVSIREYIAENTQAEAEKMAYLARMESMIDETNVELLAEEVEIGKGKAVYMANCRSCHGELGEGGVGPNLTDPYWLHGGGMKDVFKTVKYGVPEKGMISWKEKLSPKQMQQVASFIMTLGGTNPPNGKEPQGEKYTPKEKTAAEEEEITPTM